MKISHKLLQQVAFIGGKAGRPSTQIRCVQICEKLGIDYQVGSNIQWEALEGKRIVVLVKPLLSVAEFARVKQQAYVVWDLHDERPPRWEIDHYLFSTEHASMVLGDLRPFSVIPHHHLNQSRKMEPLRRVQEINYIGRPRWCPNSKLFGLNYGIFDTYKKSRFLIEKAYRQTDVLLNVRTQDEETAFHVSINPGVKLINAIGFGLPSVSFPEPAFLEIGGDVTIFCGENNILDTVRSIGNDQSTRALLRENCRAIADRYHLEKICAEYVQLFERLLGCGA
jgi:hypothetical protein